MLLEQFDRVYLYRCSVYGKLRQFAINFDLVVYNCGRATLTFMLLMSVYLSLLFTFRGSWSSITYSMLVIYIILCMTRLHWLFYLLQSAIGRQIHENIVLRNKHHSVDAILQTKKLKNQGTTKLIPHFPGKGG